MTESVGIDTEHFGISNKELQKHEYSRKYVARCHALVKQSELIAPNFNVTNNSKWKDLLSMKHLYEKLSQWYERVVTYTLNVVFKNVLKMMRSALMQTFHLLRSG